MYANKRAAKEKYRDVETRETWCALHDGRAAFTANVNVYSNCMDFAGVIRATR